MARIAEHPPGMTGQRAHRVPRRHSAPPGGVMRHATHRSPSDRRHHLQQMPRSRIAVKSASHLANSPRKMRNGPGHCARDFGKRSLCHGSDGPGHDRQQFARRHSDQGSEVFRRLIFGFRLSRELAQMLHHGIGINFADGTDLIFEFILIELFFSLSLTLLTFMFRDIHI